MKISIITVCYNSAATIRQTIESVLAQTYQDVEYIVVDGASKDGTISIVNEYSDRISTFVSEPDKGIYDAMNKGVSLATGDVIGILNSDDFYESNDAISCVAQQFLSSSESHVVFGDIVFVNADDPGRVTRFYGAKKFKPWKLRFGWMPPHPATFVRAEAYRETGLYSVKYKIAADYEMFVRLLLVKGYKFSRLEKSWSACEQAALVLRVRSSIRLNKEIVQACRANGVYTNIVMVLSKIPFKLLEYIRRPRGES